MMWWQDDKEMVGGIGLTENYYNNILMIGSS